MNRTVNYIKKRIKEIQEDEKNQVEGMTFNSEDVVQELKWVLEKVPMP